MQIVQNLVSNSISTRDLPQRMRGDGDKELRESRLSFRFSWDLKCGAAARQKGGNHIKHQRQARTFPVTDGQRPFGGFDGGRIASKVTGDVKTTVKWQLLATHAVGCESAVRKLRHGHIENDVAIRA